FSKALAALPLAVRAQSRADRARIKIDTDRAISEIDPKIYGNFIEHLGRCIDGGVFQEGSRLSDANGFRKDVLDAARKMGIGILRWPCGSRTGGSSRGRSLTGVWAMRWMGPGRWVIAAPKTMASSRWKPPS